MHVVEKDVVYPFDVDNTLVFWVPAGKEPPAGSVKADYYGEMVNLIPHKEHVQLLKANLARGRGVVVWSGNGYQWAKNVLLALGFPESADITIMAKPAGHVDDLPCTEWMGNRVWIKPSDGNHNENDT